MEIHMVLNELSYEDILENFSLLDDWEERYRYMLDLGKLLPALADELTTADFLVKGCVSQVWLVPQWQDDILKVHLDSDSHLVRGLLAVLTVIYSGKSRQEIRNISFETCFTALGLQEHLTPQRTNGVFSVVEKIKQLVMA